MSEIKLTGKELDSIIEQLAKRQISSVMWVKISEASEKIAAASINAWMEDYTETAIISRLDDIIESKIKNVEIRRDIVENVSKKIIKSMDVKQLINHACSSLAEELLDRVGN